jgi:hypothetical protein
LRTAFTTTGADGDVGDVAAVHDVDVDEIAARLVDGPDLLGQAAEVRREDRGGDAMLDMASL